MYYLLAHSSLLNLNLNFLTLTSFQIREQDCLLQGQAQLEGHFSFFHPKVKVKKTIFLTSFVFWGLVGLKVLTNFKSFQDLITNVVFYPNSSPPTHAARGGGG